jgi:ion channel
MPPVAPHRRLLAHVSSRRTSHSYGYVLLLILASFVFAATAPDARWATSVLILLESATLIAALWVSGLARAFSRGTLLLLVGAVALAVAGLVWTGNGLAAALGLISALLALAVAVVIALSIIARGEITVQSVTGAVCIYLLLGLMYMYAYGAVAELGHGPFFAQGVDGTRSLRLYFSYVTLATVGYGDYTASGDLGHTISVTEALLGQIYLVTVVAVLVSRMRPRRIEA